MKKPLLIILVLLIAGMMLDEGTTLLLFLQGYGVFETNPINIAFGMGTLMLLLVVFYASLLIVLHTQLKKRKKQGAHFSSDFLIFVICLIVAFLVVMKVQMGIANITLSIALQNEKTYELVQEQKAQLQELREQSPEAYKEIMVKEYNESIVNGYSYGHIIIIGLLAFMLFRLCVRIDAIDY